MSDFKAKMHKIRFPLGELTALPHLAVFKGPTSNGRAGEEGGEVEGKEREKEREVRGGKGGKGKGQVP